MFPAAMAPESSGEEVGKQEELAGMLTEGSFRAEEGRERVVDGEGRSSSERQWRTAVCGLDSAGGGLNRARGWSEEVRGEVERLRVRRIEVGRRGTASAASDGGFARLCSRELKEGDEGKEGRRSFRCTREDKSGARRARFAGMLDAWRRLADDDSAYGRRRAQWCTGRNSNRV